MFSKTDQARRVITPFGCTGFRTCAEEEIIVVKDGVPMPEALAKNSIPFDGPIPHDAIVHDAAGHAAYVKANTPRPEPKGTEWWTEDDIKSKLPLTEEQFKNARAAGFPVSTTHKLLEVDNIPVGRENLWSAEIVKAWAARVRTLTPATR